MLFMPTLLFKFHQKECLLNFKQNCIIFGANDSGKTLLLEELQKGLVGKNKEFLLDSLHVETKDNSVIFFNEETDFNNEFKFTNNNIFRNKIYSSIEKIINSDEILDNLNNILNIIDENVNQYLTCNMNNYFNENIKFDININNLDSIINKFTDIYINDLTSNTQISKSKKRFLIYQLLLLEQIQKDKTTYILIDNFDLYLDNYSISKVLHFIDQISKKFNCHFILTTSNPTVYSLTNNNFDLFKLISISTLIKFDEPFIFDVIKEFLLLDLFNNQKEESSLTLFKQKNSFFITEDNVKNFFQTEYYFLKKEIGVVLTSNHILLTLRTPSMISNHILCKTKSQLKFLQCFCDRLLTNYTINDML